MSGRGDEYFDARPLAPLTVTLLGAGALGMDRG